jgi:putative addiction module killer protein
MSYRIRHYTSRAGRDEVSEWLDTLRDQKAKVSVSRRIDRLISGNFGDHQYCRDGVWELRVNVGAGYRVYYGLFGNDVILLLLGGAKSTQAVDIARACDNWKDWRRRGGI